MTPLPPLDPPSDRCLPFPCSLRNFSGLHSSRQKDSEIDPVAPAFVLWPLSFYARGCVSWSKEGPFYEGPVSFEGGPPFLTL